MIAKQTLQSASLVALLVASPDFARAEPDAPLAPPGEVHPEPPRPKAPTGTFEVGAGFSSQEGVLAGASVAQNDLFGTGDRLAMIVQISRQRQQFDTMFEDPHLFGTTLSLRADMFNDVVHRFGFTRQAVGGALTLSRELAPHLRGFVGYRLQQVTVTPDLPAVLARPIGDGPPLAQRYRLATLRMGVEYNTLDQPFLPTRGTSVGSTIEVSDRALGSEVQMLRTDAWISHHQPIGPLTLHLGGSVSSVSGGAPLGERLQFAGDSDVRGYALGALGAQRAGMSLGGTFKYTAHAELEAPLIRRAGLSIEAFVDTGGLSDGSARWAGTSAGVGLIWRSPIGPVHLDVAFPLDGGRPNFVFSLGAGF